MLIQPVKRIYSWLFPPPLIERAHGDYPYVESQAWQWGWFPGISFAAAVCLIIASRGINAARSDHPYHELVFWLGLLPFYAIITWRLISTEASRRERVALVLLIGVGLYLVKVMHSPVFFTFYDELLHYRTTANILITGHQFTENPLLPVSSLYPGLENIAVALVQLGGMDIYSAGIVTILVARMVFVFALFLFYEKTSESPRLAGIATLIYAGNPHFIFFDAQFSYESLALVFVVFVLLGVEYRLHHLKDKPLGASLLLIFGICATLVTHHVTSYFLLIALIVWALVAYIFPYQGQSRKVLFGTASLAVVAILSWMMYVAIITIDYLVPVLSGALFDLFRVLLREETGRKLFTSETGNVLQLWERIVIYGTAFFVMIGLAVGGLSAWREYRNRTTYIFLTLIGMLYPITQLLRFSTKGPELASRIGPFMFLGIAFVVALGLTKVYAFNPRFKVWVMQLMGTLFLLTMFWGNFLVSFPRWALLPGSYMASADTRSIDAQSMATIERVIQFLGPDQRLASDRINGLLLVAYGREYQVTGSWGNINVPGVFLDTPFTEVEYHTLCEGGIQYLVVDYRFTRYIPMLGFYYESGENDQPYQEPLENARFEKFKVREELSLVFDDGTVRIYQVDLSYCDR